MTDDGLMHLSALSSLTRLVATPLGIEVTKGGIARLVTALPSLKALDVGLNHVGQVGRGDLEVRTNGGMPRNLVSELSCIIAFHIHTFKLPSNKPLAALNVDFQWLLFWEIVCVKIQSIDPRFQIVDGSVSQVNAVRDFGAIPAVSIVVNDPMASPSEWSGLVTSCTLCLSTSLVSLRLGLLKMDDSAFMIALGDGDSGLFNAFFPAKF